MSHQRVREVRFKAIEGDVTGHNCPGIDALSDVPLTIRAELGRTTRQVKELLKLEIGSVLTFGREVGQPVDILINKTIARGRVVEMNGNYGVQITEIVS